MSRSSSTANKKLDEKNLKTLRELAALIYNKQCFDCHQRGPTYVNMTIGSFVCTSCSGRLRGLNPPHRVKSISMATFTHDEIEFIKSRGNEYCRKVWMGRHDKSRTMDETSFKDETQMKDFLTLKYEKKRWYVSPNEIPPQELPPQLTGGSTGSTGSGSGAGGQANLQNNHLGSNSFSSSNSSKQPAHQTQPLASVQSPRSPPSTTKHNLVNLLDDPFGSPAPAPPPAATSNGSGFANFANFDAFSSPAHHQPASHQLQQPLQQTSQLRPIDPSSAMPKSATVPAMSATGSTPQTQEKPRSDKYSALKELDEIFSQPPTAQPAAPAPSWMPPPGPSNNSMGVGVNFSGQHNMGASKNSMMTSSMSAFNVGLGSAGAGSAGVHATHLMQTSSSAFSTGNPFFSTPQSLNTSTQQPMGGWNVAPSGQQTNNQGSMSQQVGANPFYGGQQQPQQPANMVANPFGGPMAPQGQSPYGAMPQGVYGGVPTPQQQMYMVSQQQAQPQQQWAPQPVPNPFGAGQQQQGGWNPFFK